MNGSTATERSGNAKLRSTPAIFNIPGHQPFLSTFIDGLLDRIGQAPESLARTTILVPTRRSIRALGESFLRRNHGQPLLLPRMLAVGDIDADEMTITGSDLAAPLDLPASIAESRRLLLLTRLIVKWGQSTDQIPFLPAQAAALARQLAQFLDQVQAEDLDLGALDDPQMVPAELAGHWEGTKRFLQILATLWPSLLAAEGTLDPSERLNRLIRAQTAAWRAQPPDHPVIAAGFAGTSPATAELLTLISVLPEGAVVLPAVEESTEDDLWAAIADDPTHPQWGFHRLLARMGVAPDGLRPWLPSRGHDLRAGGRSVLLREMMRPAALSQYWVRLSHAAERPVAEQIRSDLDRLTRIDCADPQQEAVVIALALRQALEERDATAILVTPDRALARRVRAELQRWHIDIDDSAGLPLNQTPVGVLFRLVADALAENLAPIPLLALLKHPLIRLGRAPGIARNIVRRLELTQLRGPRPTGGLAGLEALSKQTEDAEITALLDRLRAALDPLARLLEAGNAPLEDLLAGHIATAEALAKGPDEDSAEQLWAGEAGEAAATLLGELLISSQGFGPVAAGDYPPLFETLLAGQVVRPRFGRHARLQILGALEARLQQADCVILGGLNEGSWPGDTGHDPWMSRPMRAAFGLPPMESRIGLAAHDFATAMSASRVILTRAIKAGGAPTVPSRWLLRLDTILTAIGARLDPAPLHAGWATTLDAAESLRPCRPPEPRPPVALRPNRLSVTEIETWRRDPYAIFARHVLKLEALEPLDADPGLADRGQIIHQALDQYIREFSSVSGPEARRRLLACGEAAFAPVMDRPGVWAFWWPRFVRIADWFLEVEAERTQTVKRWAECKGEFIVKAKAGQFQLRARADRIDRLSDQSLVLIDYKTGSVPSAKEVLSGYSPQLALEALVAVSGGFPGIETAEISGLYYWKLSGGDPAGQISQAGGQKAVIPVLISDAHSGLCDLVEAFQDPATPYRSRPRIDRAPHYSDYAHLARVAEWGGETME